MRYTHNNEKLQLARTKPLGLCRGLDTAEFELARITK